MMLNPLTTQDNHLPHTAQQQKAQAAGTNRCSEGRRQGGSVGQPATLLCEDQQQLL